MELKLMHSCALCCLFIHYGFAATELLKNHDMESVQLTGNWVCNGPCTLESSTDHYSGRHSIKVSNRHHDWEGPAQTVQLQANAHYNFTANIKLLTLQTGNKYQKAEVVTSCLDSHGRKHYIKFGNTPYIQPGIWTEIGGIQNIPAGYHACNAYIQVTGAGADYLLDHASLQMVANDLHWKTKAQARIEQIRKRDINIQITGRSQLPHNLQVEVVQKRHDFAFGSAVGATQIVDPTLKGYQDCFYDNFEWAVLENALKWKQMEPHRGTINYSKSLTAIKALRAKGIKVRGHNVFWAVDRHVQSWVRGLNQHDLLQEMSKRINGVIGHTKGLLEQWDVNNENLHGDFYERHTGNPNITMQMFRDIYNADRSVKLFLNDFGVIEGGNNNKATALKDQAKLFKDANVPVYGIGVQSHIHNAHLDITSIKAKLDKVAEAGLPIWITELSIGEKDEHLKASALEDIYTLYFSHPAVEGILLWGFWDGKMFDQSASLFTGANLTANAAGRTYQTLFKQTWRTHETRTIANHSPISLRGFKGDYTINVRQNGHIVESENFTLGSAGATLEIHLPQHGSQSPNIIVG